MSTNDCLPPNKAEQLLQYVDITGMRILEVGPYNGRNTPVLAATADRVVCIEAREENCALVRALDLPNVEIHRGDCRNIPKELGHFDLIFHSGVLYHLYDPVQHLQHIVSRSPKLWLNTHYADRAFTRFNPIGNYAAYQKGENVEQPLAGIYILSRWLTKLSLLRVLSDVGYTDTRIIHDTMERHGPRIVIYATT